MMKKVISKIFSLPWHLVVLLSTCNVQEVCNIVLHTYHDHFHIDSFMVRSYLIDLTANTPPLPFFFFKFVFISDVGHKYLPAICYLHVACRQWLSQILWSNQKVTHKVLPGPWINYFQTLVSFMSFSEDTN